MVARDTIQILLKGLFLIFILFFVMGIEPRVLFILVSVLLLN